MSGVNKVILIGNLGKDPEIKYLESKVSVANFTLATNSTWKDKDGSKQEHTECTILYSGEDWPNYQRSIFTKGTKSTLRAVLKHVPGRIKTM